MNDDEQEEVKSLANLVKDGQVTTELGLVIDAKRTEDALRGHYDVTRLTRDNPKLVNLITWLLSLPGMTHNAIATAAGVARETVGAIAASRREPIRQFKLRQAAALGLVLDAAMGGLMERAAAGKISPFDFKLLVDAWLQLSGEGHTMKFEGTKPEDQKRQAFRQFLESGSAMVFDAETIPQTAALPSPSERPQLIPVQIPQEVRTEDSESTGNAS
jgi:hypothetical protein